MIIIIIIIAGVSRFTVTKLVKTLPYIVADVELNLIDDAGMYHLKIRRTIKKVGC
jgi:hypothetical protein